MTSTIVELHGARLMAGGRQLSPHQCLPGDRVDAAGHFLSRDAQVTLGLVVSTATATATATATVSFPLFGSACPSYAILTEIVAERGDRLILDLYENGRIVVHRQEGPDAAVDARLFTALYRRILASDSDLRMPGFGSHYYTRAGVIDHTELDTFTIDPASTEDFDDALSVGADGTLYIHIVDIMAAMHHIDLPLVRALGSSLYLANEHTEHLLDVETVDAITLTVGRIRPVITVAVTVDEEGTLTSYDVYRSTICVKQRFTYEEVAELLHPEEGGWSPHAALQVFHRLATQRSSAISYKIDMPSVRLIMEEDGQPCNVSLESTTDAAHSLVATAMILCNLVVSHHLKGAGLALPNRFHAAIRGIPVEERGDPNDLATTFCLLKKMARAHYSVDQRGHFGLGLTDYVHFTSPMRRYADIVTHMILAGAAFSTAELEAEVAAINRRAIFVRSLQRLYTRTKVNRWLLSRGAEESHEVVVTSVTSAGVQWFMPSVLLNGFCHVSKLEPPRRWSLATAGFLYSDMWRVRVGDRLPASVTGSGPDIQLILYV